MHWRGMGIVGENLYMLSIPGTGETTQGDYTVKNLMDRFCKPHFWWDIY